MNLSGQKTVLNGITPKVEQLKDELDKRASAWGKLSTKKRKLWVTSGKDPLMSFAYGLYQYLDKFFGAKYYDKG